MMPLFETVTDFQRDDALLRMRRYGVIEVGADLLPRVYMRPWPKLVSLPEALFYGQWRHAHRTGDRCWLYYNQPRSCSNFLALKYLFTTRGTRLATFFAALAALDEIARIKSTDALVCEASNLRISDRLLARCGWQPHTRSRWRRNFIKRFYGVYPAARSSLSLWERAGVRAAGPPEVASIHL